MRVLLTGANGYIGQRLIPRLLQEGHEVLCMVRNPHRLDIRPELRDQVQVVQGDLLKPESLQDLPKDIDAAYFLVHSLSATRHNLEALEHQTAKNFRDYMDQTSAQQIIYLSGIANQPDLSPHLRSRLEVEQILNASKVPVTTLRAAVIIGSGGASFEMIRDIVEKLPVMIAPQWLNSRIQPIAVRDILGYLISVLGHERALNRVFDVGGPEILTYRTMLERYAEIRGLRRLIVTVPLMTPRLSSYWIYLFSSQPFDLIYNLVLSLTNDVVVENTGIEEVDDRRCMTYREAVELALARVAQNDVASSWKDALLQLDGGAKWEEAVQVPERGCFRDVHEFEIQESVEEVIENVWQIGGERGWYYMNELWELRGFLDRMIGGVGLRRGRRSPTELRSGDALDFWRVLVANKQQGRLLLYAEMKLPGDAWLEFRIVERHGKPYLRQEATFRPRGLAGRAYWYGIWPLHNLIFANMGRKITEYRGSAPQGSPLKQQLVPREVLERNKAGDEATRPNASATRTHQQQGAPAGEPQAAEEPGNEADTTRRVAQAASYHEN